MFNSEVISSQEVSMRRCFHAIGASWLFMMILTLGLLVVFLPTKSHAFEATPSTPHSVGGSLKVQNDKCLSLLRPASYDVVPYTSKNSVTSGSKTRNLTRRHAEKATALALLLGVQFALGSSVPKGEFRKRAGSGQYKIRSISPQLMVKQGATNADAKVISVKAYRNCKKQEALTALNAWRWSR